jgi:hypothetical protein
MQVDIGTGATSISDGGIQLVAPPWVLLSAHRVMRNQKSFLRDAGYAVDHDFLRRVNLMMQF